eukprot:3706937-Pleurochrysis_carterae.AAC.2
MRRSHDKPSVLACECAHVREPALVEEVVGFLLARERRGGCRRPLLHGRRPRAMHPEATPRNGGKESPRMAGKNQRRRCAGRSKRGS